MPMPMKGKKRLQNSRNAYGDPEEVSLAEWNRCKQTAEEEGRWQWKKNLQPSMPTISVYKRQQPTSFRYGLTLSERLHQLQASEYFLPNALAVAAASTSSAGDLQNTQCQWRLSIGEGEEYYYCTNLAPPTTKKADLPISRNAASGLPTAADNRNNNCLSDSSGEKSVEPEKRLCNWHQTECLNPLHSLDHPLHISIPNAEGYCKVCYTELHAEEPKKLQTPKIYHLTELPGVQSSLAPPSASSSRSHALRSTSASSTASRASASRASKRPTTASKKEKELQEAQPTQDSICKWTRQNPISGRKMYCTNQVIQHPLMRLYLPVCGYHLSGCIYDTSSKAGNASTKKRALKKQAQCPAYADRNKMGLCKNHYHSKRREIMELAGLKFYADESQVPGVQQIQPKELVAVDTSTPAHPLAPKTPPLRIKLHVESQVPDTLADQQTPAVKSAHWRKQQHMARRATLVQAMEERRQTLLAQEQLLNQPTEEPPRDSFPHNVHNPVLASIFLQPRVLGSIEWSRKYAAYVKAAILSDPIVLKSTQWVGRVWHSLQHLNHTVQFYRRRQVLATRLQKVFRGRRARKRIAQIHFEKQALKRYLALRTIQRQYRGYRGKQAFQQRRKAILQAIPVIQQCFRSHRVYQAYLEKKKATQIQHFVKDSHATRVHKKQRNHWAFIRRLKDLSMADYYATLDKIPGFQKKRCSRLIQRTFRAYVLRKRQREAEAAYHARRHRMIIRIQKKWRWHHHELKFAYMYQCIRKIQAHWKGALARKLWAQDPGIEFVVRAYNSRHQFVYLRGRLQWSGESSYSIHRRRVRFHHAALSIQRVYRGYLGRLRFNMTWLNMRRRWEWALGDSMLIPSPATPSESPRVSSPGSPTQAHMHTFDELKAMKQPHESLLPSFNYSVYKTLHMQPTAELPAQQCGYGYAYQDILELREDRKGKRFPTRRVQEAQLRPEASAASPAIRTMDSTRGCQQLQSLLEQQPLLPAGKLWPLAPTWAPLQLPLSFPRQTLLNSVYRHSYQACGLDFPVQWLHFPAPIEEEGMEPSHAGSDSESEHSDVDVMPIDAASASASAVPQKPGKGRKPKEKWDYSVEKVLSLPERNFHAFRPAHTKGITDVAARIPIDCPVYVKTGKFEYQRAKVLFVHDDEKIDIQYEKVLRTKTGIPILREYRLSEDRVFLSNPNDEHTKKSMRENETGQTMQAALAQLEGNIQLQQEEAAIAASPAIGRQVFEPQRNPKEVAYHVPRPATSAEEAQRYNRILQVLRSTEPDLTYDKRDLVAFAFKHLYMFDKYWLRMVHDVKTGMLGTASASTGGESSSKPGFHKMPERAQRIENILQSLGFRYDPSANMQPPQLALTSQLVPSPSKSKPSRMASASATAKQKALANSPQPVASHAHTLANNAISDLHHATASKSTALTGCRDDLSLVPTAKRQSEEPPPLSVQDDLHVSQCQPSQASLEALTHQLKSLPRAFWRDKVIVLTTRSRRAYLCSHPACGKVFSDRDAVRLHVLRQHQNKQRFNVATPQIDQFMHSFWPKESPWRDDLHSVYTEKVGVFYCRHPKCSAEFQTFHELKKHTARSHPPTKLHDASADLEQLRQLILTQEQRRDKCYVIWCGSSYVLPSLKAYFPAAFQRRNQLHFECLLHRFDATPSPSCVVCQQVALLPVAPLKIFFQLACYIHKNPQQNALFSSSNNSPNSIKSINSVNSPSIKSMSSAGDALAPSSMDTQQRPSVQLPSMGLKEWVVLTAAIKLKQWFIAQHTQEQLDMKATAAAQAALGGKSTQPNQASKSAEPEEDGLAKLLDDVDYNGDDTLCPLLPMARCHRPPPVGNNCSSETNAKAKAKAGGSKGCNAASSSALAHPLRPLSLSSGGDMPKRPPLSAPVGYFKVLACLRDAQEQEWLIGFPFATLSIAQKAEFVFTGYDFHYEMLLDTEKLQYICLLQRPQPADHEPSSSSSSSSDSGAKTATQGDTSRATTTLPSFPSNAVAIQGVAQVHYCSKSTFYRKYVQADTIAPMVQRYYRYSIAKFAQKYNLSMEKIKRHCR